METLPKALCAAMSKAFSEITGALRTKENNHLRYKYACLQDVIEAIKPHIAKYGLWFYQVAHTIDGYAAIETIIVHESGESLSCGIVRIPIGKGDAQGYGSALTYARKYSLSSAFGVAQDDDDGEAACKVDSKPAQKSKKIVEIEEEPFDESGEETKEALMSVLYEKLNSASDMVDRESFESYMLYLEDRCIGKKHSFYDVLKMSVVDITGILDGFSKWIAKRSSVAGLNSLKA